MTPRPLDDYLREKIMARVAFVLDGYLEDPEEVELATDDVIEAIENEIIWASAF